MTTAKKPKQYSVMYSEVSGVYIHCTSLLRHVPVYSGFADVTKKQKIKKLNVVQTL